MRFICDKEKHDPETGQTVFESYGNRVGPWHGKCLGAPYVTIDHVQHKRCMAQRLETTYVYDFPEIFMLATLQQIQHPSSDASMTSVDSLSPCGISTAGQQLSSESASQVFKCTELVLNDQNELVEVERRPTPSSDIGMVAWRIAYKWNDDCWREIIVIANDVTVRIGSFGTREDAIFCAASRLARKLKIPRVYISANSGARIGLADEIKSRFKVAWNDSADPSKGFRYLYLTEEDLVELGADASKIVKTRRVRHDNDEIRHEITAIIGRQKDIGVENLSGSGLIAGETSLA